MNEDDFLKRWSRRKREAAEATKPDRPAAGDVAGNAQDRVASPEGAPAREIEFDPATLPPIESITALSDVTAFLRAGVPAELTRAALRRVWTADPAIRDFVGLAENAWDFTDPAAMPGFGPLESTEEVRRMIAQVVDQIGQAAKPVAPDRAAERVGAAENSNATNAITADRADEVAPGAIASPDHAKENRAQDLDKQVLLQSNIEDTAAQHQPTEAQEKPKQLLRHGHGGALPR